MAGIMLKVVTVLLLLVALIGAMPLDDPTTTVSLSRLIAMSPMLTSSRSRMTLP